MKELVDEHEQVLRLTELAIMAIVTDKKMSKNKILDCLIVLQDYIDEALDGNFAINERFSEIRENKDLMLKLIPRFGPAAGTVGVMQYIMEND